MDVDCYRLACCVFHRNWLRFGISEEVIPFPKTEATDSLNDIIPGFSKAVLVYQIASRSDLKTLLDSCPRVHNLIDFCTHFEKIMKDVFPERFVIIENLPKDRKKENKPDVAIKDQSVNTMETDLSAEDLSEDSKAEILPKDNKKKRHSVKEEISEGTMETDLPEDHTKELSKDSKKESLPEDKAEIMSKDGKKESGSIKEEMSESTMETDLSEGTTEDDLSEDSNKESLPRNAKGLGKDTKKGNLPEDSKKGKKESFPKDKAEVMSEDRKKESGYIKEEMSESTMETDLSEGTTEDDLSEDSNKESLPRIAKNLGKDTKKGNLPEDSKKESLPKDGNKEIKKESLSAKEVTSEDARETYFLENASDEDLMKYSKKESPSEDNKITAEEVPQVIAFSLAICTDLILYQYEDNKKYMQNLPDLWLKFFDENLKDLCDEVGCTSEMLKSYGESVRCSDSYFNEFVSENRNEYQDIEKKFTNYAQTNYATESPVHDGFDIEVRCFPKGLCFARMKAQFKALVESCRCMKVKATDEVPLLDDSSPTDSTSV